MENVDATVETLGAGEPGLAVVGGLPAHDQGTAVRQGGEGQLVLRRVEPTGRAPRVGGRVVDGRRVEQCAARGLAAHDEDLTVCEQGRAVHGPRPG
jgi:hypothetical protein